MGLIFDDRGNPMSPSHANKKGVRYRVLRLARSAAEPKGRLRFGRPRVGRADVEALVCNAVKQKEPSDATIADRELIKQHIERIIVRPAKSWKILLRSSEGSAGAEHRDFPVDPLRSEPSPPERDHSSAPRSGNRWIRKRETRFCGRSRGRAAGLDAILSGEAASIRRHRGRRESCRSGYVRFLMPSRVPVAAHHQPRSRDGAARSGLTVSGLARFLPAPMDRPGANARTWPRATQFAPGRSICASSPHRSDERPGTRSERLPFTCSTAAKQLAIASNRTGLVAIQPGLGRLPPRHSGAPCGHFRRLEIEAQRPGPEIGR